MKQLTINKTIKINTCDDCPKMTISNFYICGLMLVKVDRETIHPNCPLPDHKDQLSEADEKEQVRQDKIWQDLGHELKDMNENQDRFQE